MIQAVIVLVAIVVAIILCPLVVYKILADYRWDRAFQRRCDERFVVFVDQLAEELGVDTILLRTQIAPYLDKRERELLGVEDRP